MKSANRPIVFLTGYGFEDRTITVANYLKSTFKDKQKPVDFALSFGDPSSEIGKSKKWKENKFFLDEFLSRYSAKYIRVATTIRNPLEIYLQFRKTLEQNEIEIQEAFMIVDITSFPKTTLLAIFHELLIRKATGFIYYVEPRDYELPFSIGARYHGLLPFFGKSYNPNKKRILWVILGFEGHRAFSTWNNVEPDETVSFIGRPYSDNARWEKISRKENELLLQSPKVREDYISFVDVSEAVSKLESLYSNYNEENIIIAPLGTKFSTLPVAYFAQKKDNVFVAFSSAERETEHQSIGSGTIVRCEFDESHVGTAERLQLS
jgi:hypothetical protein